MIIFVLPYNVSITFFQVAHDEKSSLAKLSFSMMAQLVVIIRIYLVSPIAIPVCDVIKYLGKYRGLVYYIVSKIDTYLNLPRIGECLNISRIIS